MRSLSLIAALSLLLAACSAPPPHTAATPAAAIPVQLATVDSTNWPDTYIATGTVRARTTTTLSAKVMAYVQQITPQVGDRVTEGQLLVSLDPRDLDSAIRRAEAQAAEAQSAAPEVEHAIAATQAQLDLASTTLKRIEELASKKSVTAQELDEANARQKAARANHELATSRRAQIQSRIAQADVEVRTARSNRADAAIHAPFAGVVTARLAEPGTLAVPGAPLLTMELTPFAGTPATRSPVPLAGYRLEVSVEESKLSLIRTGQRVKVNVDACQIDAPVSEIVPVADPVSRTSLVKLDIVCPAARTGMFGRAEFPGGAQSAVTVPLSALVERGQLVSVFVEDHGVAHNRLITPGRRTATSVEVLSGLNRGERIVLAPPPNLTDGARLGPRS